MDFFKAISVLVRASAKDAATAGSWKIVQSHGPASPETAGSGNSWDGGCPVCFVTHVAEEEEEQKKDIL